MENNRRQHQRYNPDSVVVFIDNEVAEIIDMSEIGVRFEKQSDLILGNTYVVCVSAFKGDELDINKSIDIEAKIVRVDDKYVAIQFIEPTPKLLKMFEEHFKK